MYQCMFLCHVCASLRDIVHSSIQELKKEYKVMLVSSGGAAHSACKYGAHCKLACVPAVSAAFVGHHLFVSRPSCVISWHELFRSWLAPQLRLLRGCGGSQRNLHVFVAGSMMHIVGPQHADGDGCCMQPSAFTCLALASAPALLCLLHWL